MDKLEFVARKLCEYKGVDPEQVGGTWDGGRLPKDRPAWAAFIGEAEAAIAAVTKYADDELAHLRARLKKAADEWPGCDCPCCRMAESILRELHSDI